MAEENAQTLSAKVKDDLAKQVEQLADAEGKSKSEWIREALNEAASEESEELEPEDEIRADVNRLERKLDQLRLRRVAEQRTEADTSDGGIEEFLPGGERDPGPFGAINRARNGD